MHQRSLFRLLLQPSFISGGVIVLASFGVLGYSAWLYITNTQLFYNTVFGVYGLQGFISQNTQGFTSWQGVLLASPAAYYVLVGGIAVALGMAVFTALQVLESLFRSTSSFVHDVAGGRSAVWGELLARLWVRMLALIGWAVYAAAFVSMIFPFCVLLNQAGVDRIHTDDLSGLALSAVALFLLMVSLHVHIIFVRLLALRPRVFGGDSEIAAAEA